MHVSTYNTVKVYLVSCLTLSFGNMYLRGTLSITMRHPTKYPQDFFKIPLLHSRLKTLAKHSSTICALRLRSPTDSCIHISYA